MTNIGSHGHYLGLKASRGRKPNEAIKHYENLYANDIKYRDVEKKVNDFYNQPH